MILIHGVHKADRALPEDWFEVLWVGGHRPPGEPAGRVHFTGADRTMVERYAPDLVSELFPEPRQLPARRLPG